MIRILLILCLLLNFSASSQASNVDLLPKDIENRVGTSKNPEIPLVVESKITWVRENAQSVEDKDKNLTYADLSLKKISEDIISELEVENPHIARDLEILWVGVAQGSETIRYAIHKLSNPDGDKTSDSALKKIIKPIASFSTIAGTAFSSNPFVASSALVGGSLMGKLGTTDADLNYKYTKVSDTGMVLLVRKIDKLQEKLLLNYLEYKKCEKAYNLSLKALEKREAIYLNSQNKPREEVIIADVYYRNAQNVERSESAKLWSAKQALIQFAGQEAFDRMVAQDNENN